MNRITQNINDFLELFYPELCITCGDRLIRQEKYLCMNCWHDLPITNFHNRPENKVAQLFWGRVQLENATSFFAYKKGSKYQQLIHFIKYKGLKELGFTSGNKFGIQLKESENFTSVDIVIPVPLHPKKQRKRGFNQSDWIANGIANTLNRPVSVNTLFRRTHTATQTRKNRFERWQNVEDIFGVNNVEELENKHILIVDDVVTTGSTLEACAFQLLKITGVRVSVATLAFADF